MANFKNTKEEMQIKTMDPPKTPQGVFMDSVDTLLTLY